jgi:hypothetical protein
LSSTVVVFDGGREGGQPDLGLLQASVESLPADADEVTGLLRANQRWQGAERATRRRPENPMAADHQAPGRS